MKKRYHFFWLLFCSLVFKSSVYAQSSKPLPAEYVFKIGITYEITGGKPGDAPHNTETTFWFSDKEYSGFSVPQRAGILMLYDLPNKQMVTFMEDKKMVMVTDMGKMAQKVDSINKTRDGNKAADADVKIVKTGQTEKILGYSCEQYQISSARGNSFVWLTKELGTNLTNFAQSFSQLLKTSPSGTGIPDMKGIGNGIMLKMETTVAESGSTSKMEAKSIHKEGKVIATAGYAFMKMPAN